MGAPSSEQSSGCSEVADNGHKKNQDKGFWLLSSIGPLWVLLGALNYALLSFLVKSLLHDPASITLWRQEVPIFVYDRATFVFGTAFVVDLLNCLFERKSTKLDYVILPAFIKGIATTTNVLLRFGQGSTAMTSAGRVIILQRYVCWMHTTPTILLIMKLVSKSVSFREAAFAIFSDEVMLVTGAISNLTTGWLRIVMGTISHLALLPILPYLHKAFAEAIVALEPQGTSALLRVIYVVMMILWNAFGINWDLAELNWITICTEECVYLCCDFTAKVLFSSSLMLSSFKGIEQRRERVMRHIEESSKQKLIEELKHLLEQKERFMSSVSHELRTPLNGIIGISEGMLSGCCGVLPEQVRRQIYIIRTSGARLLALINDVMDAAALRQNKLILKQEQIILRHLVDDVLDLTRSLVDSTVELRNTVPPNIMVVGDTGRIVQILNNLLGNAAKFTRKGYIKVAARYHDGARKVKVTVQDTGIGIPKAKLATIFLPFEQVDMSISRKYGGFGLGLNIVQELVKAHGGEIWVESTESQGSTFTFILPAVPPKGANNDAVSDVLYSEESIDVNPVSSRNSLAYASSTRRSIEMSRPSLDEPTDLPDSMGHDTTIMSEFGAELPYNAAELSALASSKPYVDRSPSSTHVTSSILQRQPTQSGDAGKGVKGFHKDKFNTYRILSVDDDAVNQSVVRSHLSASGYDVVTVNSGSEALSYLTNSEVLPDLILLDCMMPEMDGFEVLSRLQQLMPTIHIPVIMVSAHGEEENVVRGLDHGADDYITKPFKRGEFLARIKALLGAAVNLSDDAGAEQAANMAGIEYVILCIDDDEIHQMILQGMLRNQSFKYIRAKTGKDGLNYIKPGVRPPDLVLLDCSLPDVSGFEVCKHIRELYTKSQVPVIMLSARHNEKATIEGLSCGANDYVTKPFRRGELLARIRMHLSRKVVAAAPILHSSVSNAMAEATETVGTAPTLYNSHTQPSQNSHFPAAISQRPATSVEIPGSNRVVNPQFGAISMELQSFDYSGILVASFLGMNSGTPSLTAGEAVAVQGQLAMVFESLANKYMVIKVDSGPESFVALTLTETPMPTESAQAQAHHALLPLLEMARDLLDAVAAMRLRMPILNSVRPQVLVHTGTVACSHQNGRRMFGGEALQCSQQMVVTVPPGCLGATEAAVSLLHAIGWQHVYLSNPDTNLYLVGLPPRLPTMSNMQMSAPLMQSSGSASPSIMTTAPAALLNSYGTSPNWGPPSTPLMGRPVQGDTLVPMHPSMQRDMYLQDQRSGVSSPRQLISGSNATSTNLPGDHAGQFGISHQEIMAAGAGLDTGYIDGVGMSGSGQFPQGGSSLDQKLGSLRGSQSSTQDKSGPNSGMNSAVGPMDITATEQQLVALRQELKSMRKQLKQVKSENGTGGAQVVNEPSQESTAGSLEPQGSFFKRKFKLFSRKSKKE